MKRYSGYRWQVVLGRFYRALQMVGNVTKGFVGIVKVGCQLRKAYNPTRATFNGTKGTIKF
jgi:hypothetical protein